MNERNFEQSKKKRIHLSITLIICRAEEEKKRMIPECGAVVPCKLVHNASRNEE